MTDVDSLTTFVWLVVIGFNPITKLAILKMHKNNAERGVRTIKYNNGFKKRSVNAKCFLKSLTGELETTKCRIKSFNYNLRALSKCMRVLVIKKTAKI